MSKLKRLIGVWKIFRMKRKARKLAKKTCVDHFIIKWLGQPEILSYDGFTLMRQHNVFPKNFTATQLKQKAIYHAKA